MIVGRINCEQTGCYQATVLHNRARCQCAACCQRGICGVQGLPWRIPAAPRPITARLVVVEEQPGTPVFCNGSCMAD